jgi:hypothetical protein
MHKPATALLVAALYRNGRAGATLEQAEHFEHWRAHWELIHGQPGRKRTPDLARLAAHYGLDAATLELPRLLYAIECCFVFRARLLALAALAALREPAAASLAPKIAALPGPALHEWASRLFAAEPFVALGLANDRGVAPYDLGASLGAGELELLRAEMLDALQLWEGSAPGHPSDALRAAYHRILPQQLRHGLGAYYTPPWLAEYVVATLWELRGDRGVRARLIDPACGSGVFLTAALWRLAAEARSRGVRGQALVRLALGSLVGLDINPLAVHAARANLLLALAGIAAEERAALDGPFELPVYLCDGLEPQRRAIGGVLFDDPSAAIASRFELVAGNPPWVNWEYLPPAYRAQTEHLWRELGLFELRGRQKAFSKEDISALFTYAACREYLAPDGMLGFLLPQSLFKSSLNGRAFRRFRLGPREEPLEAVQIDDLVALRPFAGAAGRPAALFLRAGRPTTPPVPYRRWRLAGGRRAVPERWSLEAVRAAATTVDGLARPSDPADPASAWADGSPGASAVLAQLSGRCAYRARTGMFTGGANGVYYVELLEELPDGNLLVRNLAGEAKRSVPLVEAVIEREFVFPLLRGRDVASWESASRALVICPHTGASRMAAVPPEELLARAPRTYAYLARFRDALAERRGFSGWERRFRDEAFYACQRIGAYTFAPYKVVWRYIAPAFTCAVVEPGAVGTGPERPVLPHEKLMQIACDAADEAYFICGVLSSSPARLFVESRMVETQIAPHVIADLALPAYSPGDPRHLRIAELCRAGHQAARLRDQAAVDSARARIDALLPGVLPLSADEVRAASAIIL